MEPAFEEEVGPKVGDIIEYHGSSFGLDFPKGALYLVKDIIQEPGQSDLAVLMYNSFGNQFIKEILCVKPITHNGFRIKFTSEELDACIQEAYELDAKYIPPFRPARRIKLNNK